MSSFEPWYFREGAGHGERTDLIGYKVVATDGEVGQVDDASYSPGHAALVVDTGSWVVGQRVLLPAGTVVHVDHENREITVDRSTAEIKGAPPYEPDDGDPTYRTRLADYYCGLYGGIQS